MKTLVLSLLRLGDYYQHLQALESLTEKPNEKVFFLVNDVFYSQLKHHPNIYFFSRKKLQKILVEKNYNWLKAYTLLEKEIQSLKKLGFDQVLDFSHTHLSRGLKSILTNNQVEALTSWQEYLNLFMGSDSTPVFHNIQILNHAAGFDSVKLQKPKQGPRKKILFQLLSSDPKKNMSLDKWKEIIRRLKQDKPDREIKILCAPNEAELLAPHFKEGLLVWGWQELENRISEFDAVISLDTSVIHLSSYQHIPSFGLFLGSANPIKTAPFLEGSKVLSAKTPCFPCSHHDACSQATHLCEDEMSISEIIQVLSEFLDSKSSLQGSSFCKTLQVYEVENVQDEFFLKEVGLSSLTLLKQKLVAKVWKNFLNQNSAVEYQPTSKIYLEDILRFEEEIQKDEKWLQDQTQNSLVALQKTNWIKHFKVFQSPSDFLTQTFQQRQNLQIFLFKVLKKVLQQQQKDDLWQEI